MPIADALLLMPPRRGRCGWFEMGWSGEPDGRRTSCREEETVAAAPGHSRRTKLQPIGEPWLLISCRCSQEHFPMQFQIAAVAAREQRALYHPAAPMPYTRPAQVTARGTDGAMTLGTRLLTWFRGEL